MSESKYHVGQIVHTVRSGKNYRVTFIRPDGKYELDRIPKNAGMSLLASEDQLAAGKARKQA